MVAEVLRIMPTWTIAGVAIPLSPYGLLEDAEHFSDGLRKAGLQER
ncbi:MAG TPA: hypothetical protein VG758_29355 [Hyphomicrobiaceae bacterium]|jgi:hypothetical protein|nr:hypothetical protein [Hyphomicrobiaceae bacterium]